jgi:hypothetical protein
MYVVIKGGMFSGKKYLPGDILDDDVDNPDILMHLGMVTKMPTPEEIQANKDMKAAREAAEREAQEREQMAAEGPVTSPPPDTPPPAHGQEVVPGTRGPVVEGGVTSLDEAERMRALSDPQSVGDETKDWSNPPDQEGREKQAEEAAMGAANKPTIPNPAASASGNAPPPGSKSQPQQSQPPQRPQPTNRPQGKPGPSNSEK